MRFVTVSLMGISYMAAQPAAPEPRHHTVYEDARVRILEVQLESQGPPTPHRHDTAFVWVSGSEIHFSRADALHAERDNEVIIELLQPQIGPHNVCGEILTGEYLHCHDPGPEWLGANLQMQFETEQTRFGILQIAPNAKLAVPPTDVPPLLIALEGTEAETVSRANGASAGSGSRRTLKAADVVHYPADQVTEIQNIGKTAARFLVVEFGGPGE